MYCKQEINIVIIMKLSSETMEVRKTSESKSYKVFSVTTVELNSKLIILRYLRKLQVFEIKSHF